MAGQQADQQMKVSSKINHKNGLTEQYEQVNKTDNLTKN